MFGGSYCKAHHSRRSTTRRWPPTRAVAVVHVKVDDGDAADVGVAMHRHGVRRADGGVVEQAEAVAAWRGGYARG
jgi:hypothetical protein